MADIARLLQSGKPLPPSLLAAGHRPALLSLFASPPPSFTVVPALSSLLSLLSDSISSDPSLASLFSSLLSLFVSGGASVAATGDGSKVFQLFSFFLSLLPTSEIPRVVDGIVSALPDAADPDGAAMADLLPCLLSLARSAAATSEIEDPAGYVDSVLGRILAVPWSKTLSVKLVSLLRELPPMAKSRSQDFLTKVFVELKGLDLQDIPAIAYQLLVLASNGFAKKMILGGIVRFFGERGAGAPIERQVEGTALLHFNFAVKQDPSLGQEVIALVRSDPNCFNHFVVSVILSVSRIRRFSESAMAVLKKKVLSAHRDYQFAR